MTTAHDIRYDGVDIHTGKYWYRCIKCNKSDWIAGYGSINQLNFYNTPCVPPAEEAEQDLSDKD